MSKHKWNQVQVVEGWIGESWADAGDVMYWKEQYLGEKTLCSCVSRLKGKKSSTFHWAPKRVRITVEVAE